MLHEISHSERKKKPVALNISNLMIGPSFSGLLGSSNTISQNWIYTNIECDFSKNIIQILIHQLMLPHQPEINLQIFELSMGISYLIILHLIYHHRLSRLTISMHLTLHLILVL